nr:transposase [uncultured Carboxylicivirga sp.]
MQGNKEYQEKLFVSFQLSQVVPEHNFYRRLKSVLNLDFLLKDTEAYYGNCGQKSLDPRVFFKLCIVGYLENIISDRKLIEHCSMRLDILYFLGYDIDELLPWHSTVSRTRNLKKLGLPEWLAVKWGFSRRGGWHVVQSPILQTTLTNEQLQKRGFVPMANIYQRYCHV